MSLYIIKLFTQILFV